MRMRLIAVAAAVMLLAGCGGAQKPGGTNPQTPPPAGQGQNQNQNQTPAPKKQWSEPPAMQIDPNKTYTATMKTSLGDMKIELFAKDAPKTVNNFVFLAREGFYDGVVFHRIIKEFMIQGGDPKGNGTGGPGYRFEDELPPKRPYDLGLVAMANAGPNTQGSQFFICSAKGCGGLDALPKFTQFGQVVEGLDVLQKLASVPTDPKVVEQGGARSKPITPPVIQTVVIEEK